jgi:His/Glu/Gln/Arg/opine family amino acid ABC transporter permease subunit
MTTRDPDTINRVYADEPPVSAAPRLVVGPLAWMQKNLFRSWLDTLLTLGGFALIIYTVTTFITWSVRWANWFAITFSLRQFMIGRFEIGQEWRLEWMTIFIVFVLGLAIAAWGRVPPALVIISVVILALLFILPPLFTLLPEPVAYYVAGNTPIVTGSVSQAAEEEVGFIGRAGDVITLRVAVETGLNDAALAGLSGFGDTSANTLRNAAANRLDTLARQAALERQLAGDGITPNQREQFTHDLERLEAPPPITDTYALNQRPVEVAILDSALEPLARVTLDAQSEPFTLTLPADGWYVLHKTVAGDEPGVTLLANTGIYPLLELTFTRARTTLPDGTTVAAQRVDQYVRMTDSFTYEGGRPSRDGAALPYVNIVENQYRGDRSLGDYLRVYLGPFLSEINLPLLLLFISGSAGYVSARLLDRRFSRQGEKPRRTSQRTATWLLTAIPPVMFVLVLGFSGSTILPQTDSRLWGGLLLTLLLTLVGILGSFPLGVLLALGRRSHLPVVSATCTLYIEIVRGVPLITVLFMSMLLLPLVNPALAGPETAAYRAMVAVLLFSAAYLAENVRGGLQSIPPGQEEAGKAVGLAGWQITLFITLPQALRAVIPALVGQFIALFKDTSLVAIVGLIDLTGIAQAVVAQTEFLGTRREVFVFISVIYFVFSYFMAMVSRQIEWSGSGATRRGL